jgi:hypothetical protein
MCDAEAMTDELSCTALDAAHLRYSNKFPTLCTVTVDGLSQSLPGSSPPPDQAHEWRLASADPRDEGRFLFRLHTLDLYFWTMDDATLFMDAAKRVLSPRQVEAPDAPQRSPQDAASPVVQQLESIAISDPAYHNGQTRNSRNQSTSLPPHLPMAAPGQPSSRTPESPRSEASQPTFAPLAYNPAAPAAPETIKHREKTPPPPDGELGTGLAGAVAADHGYGPPPGSIPPAPGQSHYFTGPGGTAAAPPTPWGAPPPPGVGISHHASVSSTGSRHRHSSVAASYTPSGTTVAGPPSRNASVTAPSFAPPPTQPQAAPQDPNAHLYGQPSPPAVQSPGTQIYGSPPYGGTHQPLQHLQPQYPDYLQQRPQPPQQPVPPPGGYATYSYSQAPEHHHHHHSVSGQGQGAEYDVHSQVYRPTEEEAKAHGHGHGHGAGPGQKSGKLEERASKVEGGVNRLLKKLEKKIG